LNWDKEVEVSTRTSTERAKRARRERATPCKRRERGREKRTMTIKSVTTALSPLSNCENETAAMATPLSSRNQKQRIRFDWERNWRKETVYFFFSKRMGLRLRAVGRSRSVKWPARLLNWWAPPIRVSVNDRIPHQLPLCSPRLVFYKVVFASKL